VNYYDGLISDSRVAVECDPRLNEGGWFEHIVRWYRVKPRRPALDIVLCRGKFAETGLVDLAAAGLAGRIFTIDHRPWEGSWPWRISKAMYGRLSGLLVHRSIGVSAEISTSAVREFAFPAHRTATCLNWVHPQFHLPSEQEPREARSDGSSGPPGLIVGYLGRLAPEKRIDVLLRSIAVLVVIAGDGWKRAELMALANQLGIGQQVRFPGWSTAPWKTLRAFDMFVLPSLVEGFPLALMEAMAVGCPCLAHPMSSTLQLIDSPKTGMLVDMTTPDGLADGLGDLIARGPAYRAQMGAAAATRIATEFSRERRLPDILAALEISVKDLPSAPRRLLSFHRA
jgi:glycosyltransferase involved in cell wall biosynthesis